MPLVDRNKQMAEVEEILGDRLGQVGFAKGFYFGQYLHERLPSFPRLDEDACGNQLVVDVSEFCHQHIDPVAIDQQAEIPQHVITGLGGMGILGACLPRACGGLELSQTAY